MALHKRTSTPPKIPFPGESPTVSLAMVAGQMYGLNETQEEQPKSSPSKAGKKKKASAKPTRKPSATRRPASKSQAKTKSR